MNICTATDMHPYNCGWDWNCRKCRGEIKKNLKPFGYLVMRRDGSMLSKRTRQGWVVLVYGTQKEAIARGQQEYGEECTTIELYVDGRKKLHKEPTP